MVLFVLLVLAGLLEQGLGPVPNVKPKWMAFALIFLFLGSWIGYLWKDKTLVSFKRRWIWEQLTKREKEVATAILSTLSNKEICDQLFIENNTLKTHIRNIYKKAGCNHRNDFFELFKK